MSSRSPTPTLQPMTRSRASSASSGMSRMSSGSGSSKKGGRRRRRRAHSNVSQMSNSSVGSEPASAGQKDVMTLRGKNQFSRITAQIKDKERKKLKEEVDLVGYVDSNRGGITSLGAKDLSGDIKKHRRRIKTEEDAEETDTPGFLLLSEQAEWEIQVNK